MLTMKSSIIIILSIFTPSAAFVAPSPSSTSSTSLFSSSAPTSRTDFLRDIAAVGFTAAAGFGLGSSPAYADEITPSGVAIKVTKAGNGPAPKIGELAAIRFASFQGETKIDDIFVTAEPYYTRVGSGGLIKGVEEVLPKMRVGDRWVLTIPVSGVHEYNKYVVLTSCIFSCFCFHPLTDRSR